MCEVTAENFKAILSEIEELMPRTKFVAIDLEFSALDLNEKNMFESMEVRYKKLRKNVMELTPMQIGVTFFTFHSPTNTFSAHVYTFYVRPHSFGNLNNTFVCQPSAFEFLCNHDFDFNKFAYHGISFLNSAKIDKLTTAMDSTDFYRNFESDDDLESALNEQGTLVTRWISKAKIGDVLHLKTANKYISNFGAIYLLHRKLHIRFSPLIRTFVDREGFKVEKILTQDTDKLSKELKQELINYAIGFTHIFRLISQFKLPLIGHNVLLDLMILIHHLHSPLPISYSKFKQETHSILPVIFDTKHISLHLKHQLDINDLPTGTLQSQYEYFVGSGKKLGNVATINPIPDALNTYHNAGFDSYCTGYIFIRMAHIVAVNTVTAPSVQFTTTELLHHLKPYKNCVNVIKGSVPHISLDDKDPMSKRPTLIIFQKIDKGQIDLERVGKLVGGYGFAQISRWSRSSAIVGMNNMRSATLIVEHMKKNTEFRVQKYQFIKHNCVANKVLWSGAIFSSLFLAWYTYRLIA